MRPSRIPRTQLEAVLDAAERLLRARGDRALTTDRWDDRAHAAAACREPPGSRRSESFALDGTGALVRSVVPIKGDPYEYRCAEDAFKSIAHAVDGAAGPFHLEDLRLAAGVTWTQAAVAFVFLKERGVVVPAGGRAHAAAGSAAFEDAMIEWHALREKGE